MENYSTRENARERWPGILVALGVAPKYLQRRHGPCPFCGGIDRFRFDDRLGRGTWICNQCGSGDGFDLLQRLHNWNYRRTADEIDRIVDNVKAAPVHSQRSESAKLATLNKVWDEAVEVTQGDPVWKYLNKRTRATAIPGDLRFHPSMTYIGESGDMNRLNRSSYPAMLARLTSSDGSLAGLHRTYLTGQGEKAPVKDVKKFMPGGQLAGSAVRLSPVRPCIGIAEGIETAIAASIRFKIPFWAATNAHLLSGWVPPTGIRKVVIAGDNDMNFTGQIATYHLAARLHTAAVAVEIRLPPEAGKDWANLDEGSVHVPPSV